MDLNARSLDAVIAIEFKHKFRLACLPEIPNKRELIMAVITNPTELRITCVPK